MFSGIIAGFVGGIIAGILSGSALGVSGPAAGLAVIVLKTTKLSKVKWRDRSASFISWTKQLPYFFQ